MAETARTIREAVGAFDDADRLNVAVSALSSSGFDRSQLSLVAQLGLFDDRPPVEFNTERQAADSPTVPRQPVVSDTDVRQARTLAASLAGVIGAFAASGITILTGGAALAAIGAAVAVGGGAAAGVEAVGQRAAAKRTQFMREQIDRGGMLLWVSIREPDQEGRAVDILRRHSSDVHVHDRPVGLQPNV